MSGPWRLAYVMLLALAATRAELVQIVTPQVITDEVKVSNTTTLIQQPKVPAQDSYLEALKASQGSSSRFDPPELEPEDVFYKDDNHYGPPQGYQYNSPPSYHSGPKYPSTPFIYGPPSPVPYPNHNSPSYGVPFSAPTNPLMAMLPSLLPKSVDLETVFKLILKLVLFKLIVKFIAVICLMLVWPLFQSKDKGGDADEDERRQFEALNELTEVVWKSIYPSRQSNATIGQSNGEEDENIVEKVAGEIDEKMTTPSEEAAIGFLQFCVSAANTVVGWMMSFLRRRNNEIDPLEELLWSLWHKFKTNYISHQK